MRRTTRSVWLSGIPLRRAYDIISQEVPNILKEHKFQMAVKAVVDTAGPDGIVPTLLVFGAYPRLTTWDAPASSITARAIAVKRAMEEVRRCQAARKVADALRMRNGPRTVHIADLPLDSELLVWREGLGWKGSYKLLAMDGQLQLPRGPVNFRSTAIKPYYRPDDTKTDAPNPQIMDPIDKENLPDDTPRRSPRNANIHEGDRPIQEGQRSITGGQTTFVRVTPPFLKVLETLELQLRFLHMFLTRTTTSSADFSQTLQQTWTLSRSSWSRRKPETDRLRSNSVRRASSQLLRVRSPSLIGKKSMDCSPEACLN